MAERNHVAAPPEAQKKPHGYAEEEEEEGEEKTSSSRPPYPSTLPRNRSLDTTTAHLGHAQGSVQTSVWAERNRRDGLGANESIARPGQIAVAGAVVVASETSTTEAHPPRPGEAY